MFWGLLGPEKLNSERRTRTLGLGAAVREFNDLAVPGMGGVWFGKQIFLATLGVAGAERVRRDGKRVQNIEMANAVEALACWTALDGNDWKRDERLRGAVKMSGKTDLPFDAVRRPTFYVTQPMRMRTVQPLRALGLTDAPGERFNSFACTSVGCDFIEISCAEYYPCHYNKGVLECLVMWAKGDHDNVASFPNLRAALSPLQPLPKNSARVFAGAARSKRRRQTITTTHNTGLG